MIDALPKMRERVKRGDANVLFTVVQDLSKVCMDHLLKHLMPNVTSQTLVVTGRTNFGKKNILMLVEAAPHIAPHYTCM